MFKCAFSAIQEIKGFCVLYMRSNKWTIPEIVFFFITFHPARESFIHSSPCCV
jgi:hypothetical protein